MILSNNLPTSSRRHIGLYPDGEFGSLPSFLSSTSLATLQPRGYAPFLRQRLKRCRRQGAIRSIVSAHIRPGIPSGPGATSREAIFFTALINSSFVISSSSSLHSGGLPSSSSSLSKYEREGSYLVPGGVPPVWGTRLQLPCPRLSGPCSQFVGGGGCGLSFASTTLYGLPQGSDSTASISSFQDQSFAALISRCSTFLAPL
jgi:hypothetical protein